MADWDKWDGQSWYRNNKNRPSGVGTVSHARREKMRQKALAREAAEALAKRDQNQAAADAAAPAAADAAAPAATNAAAPAATPSTTESSTSSSSSSSMHVDAKRAKTEPEQSLDKRDEKKDEKKEGEKDEKNVKKEDESLDKRDEKKKDPSLGKRGVADEPQGSGGASSWRTPPAPPPPKPRPLVKRGETMDPVPEPEPEGTWILKQNRNTRVAVDWHNVMEVNDVVSLKSIAAVQGLLDNGYQVFMVCFCGPHRQHQVHQKVRKLPLEFTSVKYTRARTGATGKAEWCHKNGIGHLFDDNVSICREALSKGITVWPIRTRHEEHRWVDKAWDSLHSAVSTFLIDEAMNS